MGYQSFASVSIICIFIRLFLIISKQVQKSHANKISKAAGLKSPVHTVKDD